MWARGREGMRGTLHCVPLGQKGMRGTLHGVPVGQKGNLNVHGFHKRLELRI